MAALVRAGARGRDPPAHVGAEVARFVCHAAAWVGMVACKASAVGGSVARVISGVTVSTLGDLLRIPVGGTSLPADHTALTIARSDRAACALWNPAANAVTRIPLPRNPFCSGHAFLGEGRLFVAAGLFPAPQLDGAPLTATAPANGALHRRHRRRQLGVALGRPAVRSEVMIIGGGGQEGESDPEVLSDRPYADQNTPATNTSGILDFDRPDPWGNPDIGAGLGAQSAVLEPECFDPEDETWEELCPMPLARFHHATAALLPDARVVVAGHDGFLNRVGQPSVYELEVFSPAYLHRGPRPVIRSAPATLGYGGSFTMAVPDAGAIARAALLRQSSITHQTNTDQRYVGLTLLAGGDAEHLVLGAPPHAGIAPPGFYMLSLLDRSGVPSMAHWMRVG